MLIFNHLPVFNLATLYVWLQLLDCVNQLRELQVHGTSVFLFVSFICYTVFLCVARFNPISSVVN